MNTKQLILITLIQTVVVLTVFPLIPSLVQGIQGIPEAENSVSEVYTIIFAGGVITMLILGIILVGKGSKNELYFNLFALAFLAIIFYQNYSIMLLQTLISLVLAAVIFLIKIPLRKFITNKNILA
ncbi:MAG: hypothetical protein ABFR62_04930 [Bacteroidota bacterium]